MATDYKYYLETVWDALHQWRDELTPTVGEWDDVDNAMARITEALPKQKAPMPQQTALDLN